MIGDVHIGDHVKLLGIPAWLLHDLPESEKVEICAFVGKIAVVENIDKYGYYWIGFGEIAEVGDSSRYSGHSFGVPREFIELNG